MKPIRVGAASLNQTPLEWEGNARRIAEVIEQAKREGVSLLCLPEMCICGYGCEDAFLSHGVQETCLEVLHDLLPLTKNIVVSVGLPLRLRNAVFNTVALLAQGRVLGFSAKRHLAGDGIHYEPRWFKPWPSGRVAHLDWNGERLPVGDLLFDCGGVRVGFEICEDAWVADRPGSRLAQKGVDIIFNPSASHFAFGKSRTRAHYILDGSRAFGAGFVFANLLGNESGRAIYDGETMIAHLGRTLARGKQFSFGDSVLTTAVLDVDLGRLKQSHMASFQPDLDDNETDVVKIAFNYPDLAPEKLTPIPPDWEHGEHVKEEEFTRAVSLGLFDYLRKSYSRGFVVSISGGADSAAVSCLVGLMVRLAEKELGLMEFKEKLHYIKELQDAGDVAEATGALLTCVYQGTRHSSSTTFNAAKGVAEAIGARFARFDVDGLVGQYTRLVQDLEGRELTWDRDDLALQNIQARVRGPGAWMLANLHGALLLATSNRSEAAVGYATMDGDTCGGLSPIAGIDKNYLRRWLRWLQEEGPEGLEAIPALEAVTRQAPTAELKPKEFEQTDEGDLMPYDLLDAIERAAIRDKMMPLEVFRALRGEFGAIEAGRLATWIERFFTLWCRNQWKRERYAPGFHLDDENLDPKTWCRFPILSGGFERELQVLRAYVAKER